MGEKLSAEEKQLFRSISHSKEIIPVYFGCVGRDKPISTLFTKQELGWIATGFKEFKSKGGQF